MVVTSQIKQTVVKEFGLWFEKSMKSLSLSYADSGVDINEGDLKVEKMKPLSRATTCPGVMHGVGGFASLFSLNESGFGGKDPVLVSGTDGVGTKLLVAIMAGRFRSLGQDLVAMCVNDILTTGAKPLFFLDYFATGALKDSPLLEVVEGIADACRSIGCALVGGETAELPGLYSQGHFDLAGFAVGCVDRSRIVDGKNTQPKDAIIGLGSSGLHSNGFSLARKVVFERLGLGIEDELYTFQGKSYSVADVLLKPTRLYVSSILSLLNDGANIKAMSHITGGGIVGNLLRTIPDGLSATIDLNEVPNQPIFPILQGGGPVDENEMRRVFNLGVGFTLVVKKNDANSIVKTLTALGESAMIIGEVKEGAGPVEFVG